MANTAKPMIDLPFFELCNQAPAAASTLSSLCTSEAGDDRYMYYITSSLFYRYDKIADTWMQLATPVTAPVNTLSMCYTKRRGYHGRVLGASSTTIQIPGLRGGILHGETIQTLTGTGAGQERVLTYINETVHDAGVITGTSTANISDTLKKWQINQWAGYIVGITFGVDATQYKKVLYNDLNTLYFADGNLQPHDPWSNMPFAAVAPYALPVNTAGSQAHYQIMSSTYSVPAWTTIPDYTTYFTALTGGIYLVSSSAAAPFFTLQYYDIAHDVWQTKTCPQSIIGGALGVDVALERTAKIGSPVATNLGAISSTNRTLIDVGQTLTVARYNNYRLLITGGTGAGQNRRVVNHTSTTYTISRNWDINPDATSTYELWPDFDRLYMVGNGAAAMYAYSPENDYWMQGQAFDDGVASTISCTMKGRTPIGVTSGTRIALGVTSFNPTPTAGGTGYSIGDVLTCAVGGGGAQATVTSISPGGVVTGIILSHSGTTTGYAIGAGKAVTGGTGTGCTVEIAAVGPTALITLNHNHWFARGQSVTFAGCVEGLWNSSFSIIGVNGVTSFSVGTAATANMASGTAQSATLIVDASKNWIVNEHVGRLVHLMAAGTGPTSQVRWITANTATTLTVATITAAANGTSKYTIYDSKVFGVDDQAKVDAQVGFGQATGGSTTTLIDSTKAWIPNMYAGYLFKVEAGTGYGSGRIAIVSNTATTLTFATQAFTPDSTTRYEIADAWGIISTGGTTTPVTEATYKNWAVNQWAGKRFRITGGTAMGQETAVTSNTATALTSGTLVLTDATSTYAIMAIPVRNTNTGLVWTWGCEDETKRGRSMYSPRGGGSNTLDIYDIPKGKWTFGTFFGPQSELYQAGSSYAYDGQDNIYISRSVANNPVRIFKLNVDTNKFTAVASTTVMQGTVHIGNALQIMESDGGDRYLYSLQNSGTLLSRALLF